MFRCVQTCSVGHVSTLACVAHQGPEAHGCPFKWLGLRLRYQEISDNSCGFVYNIYIYYDYRYILESKGNYGVSIPKINGLELGSLFPCEKCSSFGMSTIFRQTQINLVGEISHGNKYITIEYSRSQKLSPILLMDPNTLILSRYHEIFRDTTGMMIRIRGKSSQVSHV